MRQRSHWAWGWADRFPALHRAVIRGVRAAAAEACGGGLISCRFTHAYPDGPAPYYTVLAPGDPDPEARAEQWWAIKRAASEILSEAGATITHHHAVGRLHMPWYRRQAPALFRGALASAKGAVDPQGILNPGVLLEDLK